MQITAIEFQTDDDRLKELQKVLRQNGIRVVNGAFARGDTKYGKAGRIYFRHSWEQRSDLYHIHYDRGINTPIVGDIELAELIRDVLIARGYQYEWSGSVDSAILLTIPKKAVLNHGHLLALGLAKVDSLEAAPSDFGPVIKGHRGFDRGLDWKYAEELIKVGYIDSEDHRLTSAGESLVLEQWADIESAFKKELDNNDLKIKSIERQQQKLQEQKQDAQAWHEIYQEVLK